MQLRKALFPAARPVSVVIIVENLPVPFDRRVWNEATALTRAGYKVSVICPTGLGHEGRFECLDGISIYRHSLPLEASGVVGYLREYCSALFWEAWLSLKVLRTHGIDVIHACNPPDLLFLVALPFKLFGKKLVFDHHDINPELYIAKFGRKGWLYRCLLLAERATFFFADISLATNESYRQIAIHRGKMHPSKVYVVRSGPNLERFRPVPPRPELKEGKRFLVGYLGVMGKQEGVHYLLEAAHDIVHVRGRSDVGFVIVGGGTELEALRVQAQALGLAGHVRFTGRIADEQLLDLLSTADVCVNPDVASEMNDKSTMNKIMEYMALGKPIVQFDLTEGRYSAQEASLYATPNDASDFADKIVALLEDPALRARMGEYGRQRVHSSLGWEHSEPVLLAAYRGLLPVSSASRSQQQC